MLEPRAATGMRGQNYHALMDSGLLGPSLWPFLIKLGVTEDPLCPTDMLN